MLDESLITMPTLPRGKSVLVFDPDPKMAVFYRFLLDSHFFVPVYVGTLSDAMSALATDPDRYAAVVVDIDHADAPGWQFVQAVREMQCVAALPILAIAELIGTRAVFSRMRQLTDAIILKGDFEIPRFHEHLAGMIHKRIGDTMPGMDFNAETRIM